MSNTIYCTYLTVYHGDKLPPLYIGSTSVQKIESGYRGSVSSKKYKQIWLSELLNNPQLFETQILTTHSTREEALEEEVRFQELHDVVNSELYINMAIAKKKFIYFDHNCTEYKKKLSESQKKRYESEEARKKISESQKGKKLSEEARKNISKGHKGKIQSEETKKKMSESQKGKKLSEEARKNMSVAQKKRYENPEERKKTSESTTGRKLSEEHKKKIYENNKGKKRGQYKKKIYS